MTTNATDIELRTTRQLSAPPEVVWDAYTDAEKQKVWFTILDEEPGIVRIDTDLRVGGQQTAVWGPSEDQLFTEVQTFVEIDPPHRLVSDAFASTPDGQSMTTRITLTFTARDGGTFVEVHQVGFPSVEVRDFFLANGWQGAFDRIEAYLKRGAAA